MAEKTTKANAITVRFDASEWAMIERLKIKTLRFKGSALVRFALRELDKSLAPKKALHDSGRRRD
jgi:hypothetical protein